jgi:hypothetical protein
VQLYRYFVSQSSEFCRHNPLCCFSRGFIVVHFVMDSVRKLLDTPSYDSLCKQLAVMYLTQTLELQRGTEVFVTSGLITSALLSTSGIAYNKDGIYKHTVVKIQRLRRQQQQQQQQHTQGRGNSKKKCVLKRLTSCRHLRMTFYLGITSSHMRTTVPAITTPGRSGSIIPVRLLRQ